MKKNKVTFWKDDYTKEVAEPFDPQLFINSAHKQEMGKAFESKVKKNKDGEYKRMDGMDLRWNESVGRWIYQHDIKDMTEIPINKEVIQHFYQDQEMDEAFEFIVHELRMIEINEDYLAQTKNPARYWNYLEQAEDFTHRYLLKVESSL